MIYLTEEVRPKPQRKKLKLSSIIINKLNNERKFIQNQVFSEAKKQVISQMDGEDIEACIVYSPDWHEGVIGIVASKLVETFKVPAIVLTNAAEEGLIKGSARFEAATERARICEIGEVDAVSRAASQSSNYYRPI